MKNVLAILCLLMALLGGGCTLLVLASGGIGLLALLPIGVVVLNALVLSSVWGKRPPSLAVFYTLAVVDFASAFGLFVMLLQMFNSVRDIFLPALLLVVVIAVKGALTIWYVRRKPDNSNGV
ncbi:MAG: hypothetical protein U1E46_07315 [Hyphomicrobiales bacterium]